MKKFLSLYTQNLKEMRKFWINQFTISVFGVMITWPCMAMVGTNGENDFVLLLAALFAGGFFCFLEYDVFFQRGARDVTKNINGDCPPFSSNAGFCPTSAKRICFSRRRIRTRWPFRCSRGLRTIWSKAKRTHNRMRIYTYAFIRIHK